MRVLAIDWGMEVGLAFWDNGTHSAWSCSWVKALDEWVPFFIYDSPVPPARRSTRVDLVVCENFEISARTVKSAVAENWQRGRELMFIGATEFMCRQVEIEFVLQSAVDAKSFASNEKLKRIGWHTPGRDHPDDASRHLLLALTRRNLIDPRELLPQT